MNPFLVAGDFERRSLGDSSYRCRRCGSGPVQMHGGDLSSYCMNCSNYGEGMPFSDFNLGEWIHRAAAWIKRHAKGRGKNKKMNQGANLPLTGGLCT